MSVSCLKVRPGTLRVVDGGRQQHQSDDPRGAAAACGRENSVETAFAGAVFRNFAGKIDLHQQVDPASGGIRRVVEAGQQRRAVQ